jgi:hypothetical protein
VSGHWRLWLGWRALWSANLRCRPVGASTPLAPTLLRWWPTEARDGPAAAHAKRVVRALMPDVRACFFSRRWFGSYFFSFPFLYVVLFFFLFFYFSFIFFVHFFFSFFPSLISFYFSFFFLLCGL